MIIYPDKICEIRKYQKMASVQSMTGYGKAELVVENGKIIVELRTVNGKTADISVKSQLLPRDKEIVVRQYLAKELQRGSIDFFMNFEQNEGDSSREINEEALFGYFSQIKDIRSRIGAGELALFDAAIPSLLRMPDVVGQTKKLEVVNEENWEAVFGTIKAAVEALKAFRLREGEALRRDVTAMVENILACSHEIEKFEQERIAQIREKILTRFDELKLEVDQTRLEQEMIFYIEKLDINEERVRLRQHCAYYLETLENEPYPGRKLGFIAQEMGREINTTGSKSNNHEMQKFVVKMKDELEKIKEQSLNIL